MINYLVLATLASLLATENVSAFSFWDMEPHEVRKLINEKNVTIKAEKPDVQNVHDITIKRDKRTTPLRVYTPHERQDVSLQIVMANSGEARQRDRAVFDEGIAARLLPRRKTLEIGSRSLHELPELSEDLHQDLPIILLIHGGAWVAGNLDTHDNLARYLCKEAQAFVVSVEYLNSPEGKFPLPLEQCYDALLWIADHAPEFHADTTRLAVVGDSAGGNMAAALCLLVRDRKGPTINLQVLINPAPDLTGNGTLQRQGDALDSVRWYATQYVKDPKDVNSPYVSPLVAKDLSYLPTAVVILAENDELRPDGQRYADRLRAAGILTNVYVQWGIGHLGQNGARASLLARESLDVAVAALRGAFLRKT